MVVSDVMRQKLEKRDADDAEPFHWGRGAVFATRPVGGRVPCAISPLAPPVLRRGVWFGVVIVEAMMSRRAIGGARN